MQRMIYLSTKEAGNDHNKKTFAGSSGGTQKPWEQMGKGHFRMQPCSTFFFGLDDSPSVQKPQK